MQNVSKVYVPVGFWFSTITFEISLFHQLSNFFSLKTPPFRLNLRFHLHLRPIRATGSLGSAMRILLDKVCSEVLFGHKRTFFSCRLHSVPRPLCVRLITTICGRFHKNKLSTLKDEPRSVVQIVLERRS